MESKRPDEAAPTNEIAAFVRFCHRRRRVGWPELYDEMCAVASRRLYNGWGFAELADHGIGFSLFQTPALAAIAREIVREEADRRPPGLGRMRADRGPVGESAADPDGDAETDARRILRLSIAATG
ncbi:MAG: hypothetical protein IVW53_00245 [Chloroflexi bacterium]|nr:hypothetical protein [Chloroflexota bacterium]